MSNRRSESGMNRRHFFRHLAGAGALAVPALQFVDRIQLHAQELRRQHKACILLWMGGGPSTLDTWDPKAGSETGGPFQAISTTGEMQICEHLPRMAQQMHQMSVIRSMSTREADHNRGRYKMHTGYVPSNTIDHPGFGSIVSYELGPKVPDLAIPSFVSVGGASEGPGFLGMTHAPFVVSPNGDVRNLKGPQWAQGIRLRQRLEMLKVIETSFVQRNRSRASRDHTKVYDKTLALMTSQQTDAFKTDKEPQQVRERYGTNNFGRGCLMARRLVEAGVSFVEVNLGGWDNHNNIFPTLQNDRLPTVDQAMSALLEDLQQRGLLETTAVVWMGEFGRTPRINTNVGRDHWPRSWSVVVGGCGLNGGQAVGATDRRGVEIVGKAYDASDLFATLCHALGIPQDTVYTSRTGRPVKVTDNGQPIKELVS
jgi:hypothetical protein